MEGSNVKNVESLSFLDKLKTLKLKGNKISDIDELSKALTCMPQLDLLSIVENPIVSNKKYRDSIVVAAIALSILKK